MAQTLRFPVIVEPYPDTPGRYYASCPALPDMGFLGASPEEALAAATRALEDWVETARTQGWDPATEVTVHYVEIEP